MPRCAITFSGNAHRRVSTLTWHRNAPGLVPNLAGFKVARLQAKKGNKRAKCSLRKCRFADARLCCCCCCWCHGGPLILPIGIPKAFMGGVQRSLQSCTRDMKPRQPIPINGRDPITPYTIWGMPHLVCRKLRSHMAATTKKILLSQTMSLGVCICNRMQIKTCLLCTVASTKVMINDKC